MSLLVTPNPSSAQEATIFFDYQGFPGYIVQLLADDEVIAEDINSVLIAEGDFAEISLSLTVGDSLFVNGTNLIGMALGIRLLNQNTDLNGSFPPLSPPLGSNQCESENDQPCSAVSWSSEVDFDNVQLSVSAVPVPAAIWLFGTALIGLIGFGKRRKVA
jgi:hypothetical protein